MNNTKKKTSVILKAIGRNIGIAIVALLCATVIVACVGFIATV